MGLAFSRFLAALVLAIGVVAADAARASVVTFEGQAQGTCQYETVHDSGLTIDHGFYACFAGPQNTLMFPADAPLSSTVLEVGFGTTTFTADNGGVFDLESLSLALGANYQVFPENTAHPAFDTTTVTGYLAMGGPVTLTLDLGYAFQTVQFGADWTNLTSVTFSELASGERYLALDNVTSSIVAVPEPDVWAMMLLGGFAVRRARRGAARLTQPGVLGSDR